MIINLRNCSEVELLEFVRLILSINGPIDRLAKLELQQINDEFIRRDALKASNICGYCHHLMNDGPRCGNCGAL